MVKEKTICHLELHETLRVSDDIYVIRVPGGWIYVIYSDMGIFSTFVPYNTEFLDRDENGNVIIKTLPEWKNRNG